MPLFAIRGMRNVGNAQLSFTGRPAHSLRRPIRIMYLTNRKLKRMLMQLEAQESNNAGKKGAYSHGSAAHVTLDHNSIIALEHPDEPQQRPIAEAIRELKRYHDAGYIALKITSSTMLENPRPGEEDLDVAELIGHYQKLGLGSVELFRGPHVLSFTDGKGHLCASPALEQWFLRNVHMLLHPTIDFDLRAYCRRYCKEHGLDGQDAIQVATIIGSRWLPLDAFAAQAEAEHLQATRPDLVRHAERIRKKWHNAKSDALGLCTHASWGGAIFVTNDGDFHRKNHDELERLTNGQIVRPREAIAVVQRTIGERVSSFQVINSPLL